MIHQNPSFKITNKIFELAQAIARELGVLSGAKLSMPPLDLRRVNMIKTIQSSLAIEGNSLSIEQITAVMDGKRVLAPKNDIIEASNAIKLYSNLGAINPLSSKSMLDAHAVLMRDLKPDNGSWRRCSVGVYKDGAAIHIGPPFDRVPFLMEGLFKFVANDEVSWLFKACVFHYELEFIHPFSDGNGRMGRLWQQLLLMKADPIFEFIPVEALVKNNQQKYYDALQICDNAGESTLFIEFMCKLILEALQSHARGAVSHINSNLSRLEFARSKLQNNWFTRQDYLLVHKDISTATASRDMALGLEHKILVHQGIGNQMRYRYK
jgi:Fic family protein